MSKPKFRLYVLIMVCQHNTYWSSNTLVPKSLEPNKGQLHLFDDFVKKYVKTVTVTDLVFTTWKKSVLNHFLWIRILGVVFINSKTHMVVMEVVSQHLDWYKNNDLIYKLHEILSGQIWACCFVWFLINHDFILWLWNWYGIY